MKSHTKQPNSLISSIFVLSLLMAFTFANSTTQVPVLSEDIMNKIFNNYQYLVIYVSQQHNPNVYEHFSDYCLEHSCAYLDKTNSLYENIRNFVGHPHQEYFLILDAPRQLKYVHEIKDKEITYKDIYNFEAAFTSQKLKPYFSSEQAPTQVFEPCRKLVGKNFDQFLALSAPIKVVYLYTQQPTCDICGQMLRGFADIAEKIYREDVIAFGYFDIFKNDHERIPTQVAPYFLVFKEGQDEPYGIEGQQFPELETALINIIAEQIYPGYRDAKNQEGDVTSEDLTQQTIEELQDLEIPERDEIAGAHYEL